MCIRDRYLFSYNNVKVPLKISDIYYIEKEGKLLVYHTRRGEFRERKNMKDAYEIFKPYNFLWIHVSYLVNIMYIMKIENDMVMLPSLHLPISRSKKEMCIRDSDRAETGRLPFYRSRVPVPLQRSTALLFLCIHSCRSLHRIRSKVYCSDTLRLDNADKHGHPDAPDVL